MTTIKEKMPRGIRNCNPLNIIRTKTKWAGMAAEQTDPKFVQFANMRWGLRAAFITLRNYYKKYGLTTVEQVITRWAPPSDGNDTETYIETVCSTIDYGPNQLMPDIDDYPVSWCALVRAMAIVEVGEKWAFTISLNDLVVAWHMMQLARESKA